MQDRLEALTKTLSELPVKRLGTLGLDDKVVNAIRELAAMTKGSALARQRRGVATMLREYDLDDLSRKIDRTHSATATKAKESTPAEDWRERLMTEGDRGLDAFLAAYPRADRQRFRQALRAAAAERKEGKTNRRAKELTSMVASLGMPAEIPADETDGD